MNGGKVVGLLGHPFVGTADFKRFTYVWCKDNKVPGERGKPLAKVPIPAVCIGAEGRPRIGDGYLSDITLRTFTCARFVAQTRGYSRLGAGEGSTGKGE